MSDIQGFIAKLTLDSVDITLFLNDLSLDRSKNVMSKPTMDGTGNPTQLPGQRTGTLSMNGQVDNDGIDGLEASWAKDVPVAFDLRVGDDATILAGNYTGLVGLDGFTVAAATDGTWDFTLSGATSGAVTYTPTV